MAKRGPKLPVWGTTTNGVGEQETEAIRRLCTRSRYFYWLSNFIPITAGSLIGYHGGFQSSREWLDAFSKILLTDEYRKLIEADQDPRQNFLQLSKCRRLRSGAVLLSLYLFAQEYKTENYSDQHFKQEADAAKELRNLIRNFEEDARPHLATLQKAPGLWSHEAEEMNGLIQQMKRSLRKPSDKRVRNSVHRSTSQTLLRLSVLFCGYLHEAQLSRTDTRWWVLMRILSVLLGPKSELNGEHARSLAKTAAWAAGKWTTLDALKRLYYQELEPASKAIEQHVHYHLGSTSESMSAPPPKTDEGDAPESNRQEMSIPSAPEASSVGASGQSGNSLKTL